MQSFINNEKLIRLNKFIYLPKLIVQNGYVCNI